MKRPTKIFITYGTDPAHWTNHYPWNRKGTNARKMLEHFLEIMERAPGAEREQRRDTIAWLRSLLDATPPDLFP